MEDTRQWLMDNVSNMSYTNKDFNTIYPELLDLVKKLTNKWDPSLSNESDPGVLLLKLVALMGDKNNYNIDKNVLECFPQSVTQMGNARKLYEALGYNMHWYKSATTNIGFKLVTDSNMISLIKHTIPRFTMLTDSSGEHTYTLLQDVALVPNTKEKVYGNAIEGTINDFQVNGSKTILLSNLDENLRLYFSERMVAENGIFISNISTTGESQENWDDWKSVKNIDSYEAGKTIFEFGILPNSDTCYIQFPRDIATKIGNGLNIKYVISNGREGNIKAFVVNSFYGNESVQASDVPTDSTTPSVGDLLNDNIIISQNNVVTTGENPETLDDAYRNFKKTVGTFNTLVTKRDYFNYIFNNESEYLSNLVVADRTNDINGSCDIITWTPSGSQTLLSNPPLYTGEQKLTAYDLLLYLLNPANNIYNEDTFNNSFKQLVDDISTGKVLLTDAYTSIISDIDDIKSAQHDIDVSPTVNVKNPIFICNNKYTLMGTIYTYYKVTLEEKKDIEKNVRLALFANLNSRKVDFGYEISYDKLVSIIQNADTRIKNVVLNLPTYTINFQRDGVLTPISPTNLGNDECKLIAKSILSGHTQLYSFNDDFKFDFGQGSAEINGGNPDAVIEKFDTLANITITANDNISLNENEIIQFIKPNLVDEIKYTTNVKYTYNGNSIPSNIDTKLESELTLKWIDDNNVERTKTYNSPTVINSSIELTPSTDRALTSGQSITIRKENSSDLKTDTPCYWILNSANNTLTIPANGDYILQDDEYFIYTDEYYTNIVILGANTKIHNTSATSINESLKLSSLEDLTQNDTSDIGWYLLPIQLKATQMQLRSIDLTYTTNGYTTIFDSLPTTNPIGNDLQEYTGTVTIRENGNIIEKLTNSDGNNWEIRSRLLINADNTNYQTLQANQKLTIYLRGSNSPIDISGVKGLLFNYPVATAGGTNIDVAIYTSAGDTQYLLKVYSFVIGNILTRVNGLLTFTNTTTLNYTFSSNYEYYIPVHATINSSDSNSKITLGNCYVYDPYNNTTPTNEIIETGNYILKVNGSQSSIGFTFAGTDNTLLVGYITIKTGVNEIVTLGNSIDPTTTTLDVVYKAMKDYDTENNFDWLYRVPENKRIDNPLDSNSFWSTNHPYNAYTIPQWDIENSSITVANTSLR